MVVEWARDALELLEVAIITYYILINLQLAARDYIVQAGFEPEMQVAVEASTAVRVHQRR